MVSLVQLCIEVVFDEFRNFSNRLSTSVSGQSSGTTTPASSVGNTISSLSVMAPALKLTTSVSTPQTTFPCPRPTGKILQTSNLRHYVDLILKLNKQVQQSPSL